MKRSFASVEIVSTVERRRLLRQQLADGLIPIEEFMRAIEATYPPDKDHLDMCY
jgi:hypothetical protein